MKAGSWWKLSSNLLLHNKHVILITIETEIIYYTNWIAINYIG